MIWVLRDFARLKREREALVGLEERAGAWLSNVAWRLDGKGNMCVDADIGIAERTYAVTMRYPYHFPSTPPSVLPRGEIDEWWSSHQYGAGGELCLEYGPDNWHPTLTGADMLESAWRLLSAEAPTAGLVREEISSRHETSTGQYLRSRHHRLVTTWPLFAQLSTIPIGTAVRGTAVNLWQDGRVVMTIKTMGTIDGPEWSDPSIPHRQLVDHGYEQPGLIVRLPDDATPPDAAEMPSLVEALTPSVDLNAIPAEALGDLRWILFWDGQRPVLTWRKPASAEVVRFAPMFPTELFPSRLDAAYGALRSVRVGIVGCGSVGSKVAVSLARSGIGQFVLVDDDVFGTENLVRHDLDWLSVGFHKADAIAGRIALVSPSATCEVRRVQLAGQEASGSVDSVLKSLGNCDLIIDASANPAVFNLLSQIAGQERKAMIWVEVFAGGIGGMVARHRPGREPDPQTMRQQILTWCGEHEAPWPTAVGDYAAAPGAGAGAPEIADDGDVSFVASTTARIATDTLLRREPTKFPYAVYMLGLSRGWIFEGPFDTYPIDVGLVDASSAPPPVDEAMIQDGVAFLTRLLPPENETPSAA